MSNIIRSNLVIKSSLHADLKLSFVQISTFLSPKDIMKSLILFILSSLSSINKIFMLCL